MQLPKDRITSWGKTRAESVPTDDRLPASADVVIVGGGAMGVLTALFLRRHGLSVTVCEKGEVAAEASSRAFGWVSGLLLDKTKMDLSRQGIELWQSLQDELGELGFRQSGLCYFAEDAGELGFYERWRDDTREVFPGVELLGAEGVRKRFPGLGHDIAGGILATRDSSLEPRIAVPRVAKAALTQGVTIVQRCAARGLELTGGKVGGVVTERGRIATGTVICAANLWSRLFAGNLGIDLPQVYAIMSMGATGAVDGGPQGSGGREDWAWRAQVDGGYSLGRLRGQRVPITRDVIQLFGRFAPMRKVEAKNVHPTLGRQALHDLSWPRRWRLDGPGVFEKHRILNFAHDRRVADASFALNREHFAAFGSTGIEDRWEGAITVTPDNVPTVSPTTISGFYIASGCSYGLTWAPSLGRMLADMIVGTAPRLDPSPYRLSRFTDGTKLVVKM